MEKIEKILIIRLKKKGTNFIISFYIKRVI